MRKISNGNGMPDQKLEDELRLGFYPVGESLERVMPTLCSLIERGLREHEQLSDPVFDLLYHPEYRRISSMHWTPLFVARTAMSWLPADRCLDILDVGCGVGKFCLAGSLVSKHRFFGVEYRAQLAEEAQRVAGLFPLAKVAIEQADAFDCDWSKFAVLYLYNPFFEVTVPSCQIDEEIESGEAVFRGLIKRAVRRLLHLPPGTLVLTYYTFGAAMPPCYEKLQSMEHDTGCLELWCKRAKG